MIALILFVILLALLLGAFVHVAAGAGLVVLLLVILLLAYVAGAFPSRRV